jgi:hypothetical protein
LNNEVEPGEGQGSTKRYLKALISKRARDTNKQRSKIRRNINGQGSKCSKTKEVRARAKDQERKPNL